MKKSSHTAMLPFEAEDVARLLGAKIRTARIARNWTQVDLSERCGISKSTVLNIETGAVSVQFGFVLKALWAVGLIGDVLDHLKNVGINDHEFALLESAQPKRVRDRRNP